jgi:sec-independent protein translocase protein TatA
MPSLGPAEILVILVVALLVFGPNKMPEIARQVGKGFREFRRVQQHLKSELRDVVAEFDSPSSAPAVEQQAVPMLPPQDDAPAPAAPPAPTPTREASTPSATPAPNGAAPESAATLPTAEPDAPSEPA